MSNFVYTKEEFVENYESNLRIQNYIKMIDKGYVCVLSKTKINENLSVFR